MRHPRGVAHERLHPAETLPEREEAARGHERDDFVHGAIQLERHHAAESRHLPLRDLVAGICRQSGEVHATDDAVRLEGARDRFRVVGVALHPQLERLEPPKREPTVERRRDRAGRILQELHRLEDGRVPGEHGALHEIRMAAEILRHAVHDDVGAERERLLEERRGECVVHDEQRARRVRRARHRGDVVNQQPRVGRRLDPDQPRLRRERRVQLAGGADVDLADHAAVLLEHAIEDPVGAAVDVQRDHDFIARPEIRLEHRVLRGEPRGEERGVFDPFQLREYAFEPGARRVVRARVVVPAVHARRGLFVRGRRKDGSDERAGLRFRGLPGVDGLRRELHGVSFYA